MRPLPAPPRAYQPGVITRSRLIGAAATAVYLTVVLAWAHTYLGEDHARNLSTAWAVALVAVHPGVGLATRHWRSVLLPLLAVVLTLPAGRAGAGEVEIWVLLVYWSPFAVMLIAMGVAAGRYLPLLLRTRAA